MVPADVSQRADILDTVIQLAAAALSAAGLAWLVARVSATGDAGAVAAVAVYGAALVATYTISAVYHGTQFGRTRPVVRALDHCAIFVLIAATHTPFAVLALWPYLGWLMLAAAWAVALIGVALRLYWIRPTSRLASPVYLALGWFGLGWSAPLIDTVGVAALALVIAGGIAYVAGLAVFLNWRSPYAKPAWHAFVVAGSALQFAAIAVHVLPHHAAAVAGP